MKDECQLGVSIIFQSCLIIGGLGSSSPFNPFLPTPLSLKIYQQENGPTVGFTDFCLWLKKKPQKMKTGEVCYAFVPLKKNSLSCPTSSASPPSSVPPVLSLHRPSQSLFQVQGLLFLVCKTNWRAGYSLIPPH